MVIELRMRAGINKLMLKYKQNLVIVFKFIPWCNYCEVISIAKRKVHHAFCYLHSIYLYRSINFLWIWKKRKLTYNGPFTPNDLLPTVRSDCKKLGASPIASNGLKPVSSDSQEQIYFKIIWCEWSIMSRCFSPEATVSQKWPLFLLSIYIITRMALSTITTFVHFW